MRKLFFAAVISSLFTLHSSLGADAGKSCFDFLSIPGSSLMLTDPLATGPSSLRMNPAGIHISKTQTEFTFARWYGSLNNCAAGFGQQFSPRLDAAFFAQTIYPADNIQGYDSEGVPAGQVKYSDSVYSAGAAYRPFGSLRLGAALSLAGENLDGDKKSSLLASAGAEVRMPGGPLGGLLRGIGINAPASETVFSANFLSPFGKIKYGSEEDSPLAVNSVFLKEYTGPVSLTVGADFSDTTDMRLALGYRFSGFFAGLGALSDSSGGGARLSAAAGFIFSPLEIDFAYLNRADLGGSFFSTVKYGFDLKKIAGSIKAKQSAEKKEKRQFSKVGKITDIASSMEGGVSRIWINFSSNMEISGRVAVAKENKLAAYADITDTLSVKPLVYEALVENRALIEKPAVGDIVAVSEKYLNGLKKKKQKEKEKKRKKTRKKLERAGKAVESVRARGWKTGEQNGLLNRAGEFYNKGDYDACAQKLGFLDASLKKLYAGKAKVAVEEAASLLKDARSVGVNVSYPESLYMKARSYFEKKNYEEALSNASEAVDWLNRILNQIDSEQ